MSKAQKNTDSETTATEKQTETSTAKKEPVTATPIVASSNDNAPPPAKKGGGTIGFIALIIAIAAFGAGYKAWQQIGIEQGALSQRIDATEKSLTSIESGSESSRSIAENVQSTNQLLQNHLDSMETKVSGLDDKLTSNVGELQQSDSVISDSLNKLSDSLRTNQDDNLLVAEARHLINIANHQAQLNQDSAAAAAALVAADQRLRDAADPSLLEARQIITDDIIALRNVTTVDISGIALTLSQLEASINGLPLSTEEPELSAATETEPAPKVTDASSFFNKVWSDIKGLVSIRRNNSEHSTALLPPGQRFFLQQNLRLKLETARLALLQRDSQTFQSSLATAKTWVESYFDTSAANTANLLTSIAPYQSMELKPALPDLSRSLKALDSWSSKQKAEVTE